MALYCSQGDLDITAEDLAGLTTETGDQPDPAVVNRAIAEASARIDAYCGGRYTVPFDPVPEFIRQLAKPMAAYYLYLRREAVPEAREAAYKDALKVLERIAEGKAIVPGAEGRQEAPAANAGGGEIASAERLFTRDSLEGF